MFSLRRMSNYFSITYKIKYLENTVLKSQFLFANQRKFIKCKTVRHFATESNSLKDAKPIDQFVPFLQRLNLRRAEAKRSVIVQVQSTQSFKELWTYCNSIGGVKYMFHYTVGLEPLHFIIVEFENEIDVKNILRSSIYPEGQLGMPTQSHFVWFKAAGKKSKLKQSKSANLVTQDGTQIRTDEEIGAVLRNSENISDQIKCLHEQTTLNDVGTRLRFLTASQIEDALSGMFPAAIAYPFGSSVNGYGKMGCDLDLFLRLSNDKKTEDGRLVFHCKPINGSERTMTQRHMEAIGDLIHLFLPGCGHVRRILQARVPIIKYHQQLTDVECDVSMSNMSGVHMSDFLYIMGELDDRVRPLVFTVRNWAKAVGITNSTPGRWISNFSLTLLVLAFLQKPPRGKPVLPTLNVLEQLAGKNDKFQLEDGTDCSFLRDITRFKTATTNKDSLEQLLIEFFEYYAHFDFDNKAVCLNDSIAIAKPEFSPMYIINPLERGLNVSKNVSLEEVLRFKSEVRNAAWILESQETKSVDWGLLSILQSPKGSLFPKASSQTKSGRLVELKSLFERDDQKDIKTDRYMQLKNKQR